MRHTHVEAEWFGDTRFSAENTTRRVWEIAGTAHLDSRKLASDPSGALKLGNGTADVSRRNQGLWLDFRVVSS
jgi:hypothetical protein